MVYAYRVFIDVPGAETDALHFADEKLYEGAIFRANKPGTELHGSSVIVERIDSHPTADAPGIAHGRTEG